jgi:hypothetical protein
MVGTAVCTIRQLSEPEYDALQRCTSALNYYTYSTSPTSQVRGSSARVKSSAVRGCPLNPENLGVPNRSLRCPFVPRTRPLQITLIHVF